MNTITQLCTPGAGIAAGIGIALALLINRVTHSRGRNHHA